MKDLQDQLITELGDLILYLDEFEEHNWSSIFSNAQKLIGRGDIRGLDFIKGMKGGMGSFTDLVLCRVNGHKIEKSQEDFANQELMRLGEKVFATVDKLRRELNKGTPFQRYT